VMLSCLVSSGCTSTPSQVFVRPDPPPANLLIECDLGPDYPTEDASLGAAWRPVLEQRTFAQGVCASRHRELAVWARKVTASPAANPHAKP
jgi:hypothetical protein